MDGGNPALQQLLFFALLIAGLYFLAIRPQRARAKALAQVRAGLAVGTRVMTAGGMHGTVAQLDDDDTVVLELAPGVPVRFATGAVVRILEPPPGTEGPAA
jgi:preprotein translocase subunit YajC